MNINILFLETLLVIIALCPIFYYILVKERLELGCVKNFSIQKHCDDLESVYVKGTKMDNNDTCDTFVQKIVSILSYHEKGAVWRRSFIVAIVCCLVVFLVYRMDKRLDSIYHYIVILVLIFTIIYFYHNYLNYHHFRNLKNNGVEILDALRDKCFNKGTRYSLA